MRAKIFFTASFSRTEIKKEFRIDEILSNADLPRQKNLDLRKSIILVFDEALEHQLIEPIFTIRTKRIRSITG